MTEKSKQGRETQTKVAKISNLLLHFHSEICISFIMHSMLPLSNQMINVLRRNPHQQESPKSASMDVVKTFFISFQQNHFLKLSILSKRNLAKISFLSLDQMLFSTSFSFKSCQVTVSLAQTLFLEVTPEHTMFLKMLILVPGMR